MKSKYIHFNAAFILITFLALASACQVGVHKDLVTGLAYHYHGLGVEDIVLTKDGQAYSENQFPIGSTVVMNFLGVNGFKEREGKVFPGLSVQVKDQKGTIVLQADDLFTEYSVAGLDATQANELSSNLTIGDPMQSGTQYTWHITIWDKQNDGLIEANMDFAVQP